MLFPIVVLAIGTRASSSPITLIERSGRSWFQVEGRPFWSFGVDCVDTGDEPGKVKADNPGYSALKLFRTEADWTKATQSQLEGWGFNTLGGWCDIDLFKKYGGAQRMPYTVVLHLGAYDQAPWHDLFAPQMEKAMDGAARDQIPKYRDDSYLLGYFSDNELGWWDDTLFTSYLAMPAGSPGRLRLIQLLKETYRNDLDRFSKDWTYQGDSFETLHNMHLKPGGQGRRTIKAWAGVAACYYYKLAHDIIRRYDKNHLIMGDRYCQYFTVPVVKAAAPYVDVVSTNYGADWNDGSTCHFGLDTLHSLTGKPVIVTEFYMCATENRSGDKNSSDGFPVVPTQKDRAKAFGKYVESVAARPYVVGAHWFQFADEPGKGRGDGENYNMGLLDIAGRPYEELTQEARRVNPGTIHGKTQPAEREPTPGPAPPNALNSLKGWDRVAGYLPPSTPNPVADLYCAWSPEGLLLGAYAMDYADPSLYEDGKIPESERESLTLWLSNRAEPIVIKFGGGRRATFDDQTGIRIGEVSGLKQSLMLFLPAKLLGHNSVTAGTKLHIRAHLTTHGRAETVGWNQVVTLSK